MNPTPTIKQITMWGEFYPSDAMLWLLLNPPLEPGDVIIDPKTDKRYLVQRKRTVELLGVPIEQQIQLNLIHIDDELYSYQIPPYLLAPPKLVESPELVESPDAMPPAKEATIIVDETGTALLDDEGNYLIPGDEDED